MCVDDKTSSVWGERAGREGGVLGAFSVRAFSNPLDQEFSIVSKFSETSSLKKKERKSVLNKECYTSQQTSLKISDIG